MRDIDDILGASMMSRRDVFLACTAILSDDELLSVVAGKDATLDATMYLIAKEDAKMLERLNTVISTDELIEDARHIAKSAVLEELKEKLKKEFL